MTEAAATPTSKERAYAGRTGETIPYPMAMTNAAPTRIQISRGIRSGVGLDLDNASLSLTRGWEADGGPLRTVVPV